MALFFGYLFLERGSGSRVFQLLNTDFGRVSDSLQGECAIEEERLRRLEEKHQSLVEQLLAAGRLDNGDRRWNSLLLTISSVIGTLAWGFGDLVLKL